MRLQLQVFSLVLAGLLLAMPPAAGAARAAGGPETGGALPRPQIMDAARAPQAARVLAQVALAYEPQMPPAAREQDYAAKVALAKRLLGVKKLVELRKQTLALLPPGQPVSWEDLRRRRFTQGDQVGVTLRVPVWVPARAQRLTTYSGFEKRWQVVAETTPRPSGHVWFVRTMAEVNDKAHYKPETIQVEVNSRFAPLLGLLLEYVFREGYYDVNRRVALLVVRSGEDAYAVSAHTPPAAVECLSFPDKEGDSLAATVATCTYHNLAEIYHGHHEPKSNHRLGLAIDFNDFNFAGVIDGPPNPISRSLRQFNREAMHRLDARQLPNWVYRAAKLEGMRLPQEWTYESYKTDWEHVDVGTK